MAQDTGNDYQAAHYRIKELNDIDDVRKIFKDKVDFELNWLFLSTSGIHGSYLKADELEEEWDNEGGNYLTVLVCRPRLVNLAYGHIEVPTIRDLRWLKGVARLSLQGIAAIQGLDNLQGSLAKEKEKTND